MPRIVGTDIFHAAALLWVAGAGHLIIGDVDLHATAWLLARLGAGDPDLEPLHRDGPGHDDSGRPRRGSSSSAASSSSTSPEANWVLGGGLAFLFVVLTIYTVSVMRSQQPRTAPEQPRTTPERA